MTLWLYTVAAVFLLATLLFVNERRAPASLIGVVLVAALVTLRPGILGETAGPLGAVLLLAVLALGVTQSERSLRSVPGRQTWALVAVLVLPVVLGVPPDAGVVIAPVVAAAGWVAGRNRQATTSFVNGVALLAAWQTVALVLTAALRLPTWEYSPTRGRVDWFYEVSPLGSISTGSGGVLRVFDERLTGPFGEPGVFASILVIVAMLDIANGGRIRPKVQLALAVTIVLTQSIAGVALYVAGVGVVFVLRALRTTRVRPVHWGAIFGACFGSVWAASGGEGGVLAVKYEANSISAQDRLAGVSPAELAESWGSSPFGIDRVDVLAGVNLLQLSVTLGPLILLAGLWLYLAPLRGVNSARCLPVVAVTLATALFAQPPFVYSWILFAFVTSGIAARPVSTPRSDSGDLVASRPYAR